MADRKPASSPCQAPTGYWDEEPAMMPSEWKACVEPQAMLAFLRTKGMLTERKARLFAVACCRRNWALVTDSRSREAVAVLERGADGNADKHELVAAANAAEAVGWELDPFCEELGGVYEAAWAVCDATSDADPDACSQNLALAVAWSTPDTAMAAAAAQRAAHAAILRELFCPFRPAVPVTWPTSVVTLAIQAYEYRTLPEGTLDPDLLAVVLSCLADAGCTDTVLLEHLRGAGPTFAAAGVSMRCWGRLDAMTEREWLSCSDPRAMLEHLSPGAVVERVFSC
jgi:hypothetical protein